MTIHSREARWFSAAMAIVAVMLFPRGAGVVQVSAQENKFQAEMLAGETLLKQRKYEEAVEAFKRAIRVRESFTGISYSRASVDAYLALSRAYLGLGAFKNALQSCDDAMKNVAGDKAMEAMVHNQRGLAFVASAPPPGDPKLKPGDPKLKSAETEFRAVLEITDTDPMVFYNLGVTLLRLSRDAEGVHELHAFVARARTPEVETARRMIDEPRRARENFAPDFSVTTLDGEFVTLKDLKGKVVLLDFWGTWCPPCLEATPSLVRFSRKHSPEQFVMIGVAVNEASDEAWRDYIEKNKMTWPQYIDKARKMAALFQVTRYPTYITIDREGIIRDRHSGWGNDTMSTIDGEVKRTMKTIKDKLAPTLVTPSR